MLKLGYSYQLVLTVIVHIKISLKYKFHVQIYPVTIIASSSKLFFTIKFDSAFQSWTIL